MIRKELQSNKSSCKKGAHSYYIIEHTGNTPRTNDAKLRIYVITKGPRSPTTLNGLVRAAVRSKEWRLITSPIERKTVEHETPDATMDEFFFEY